jgi:hypothetical protein
MTFGACAPRRHVYSGSWRSRYPAVPGRHRRAAARVAASPLGLSGAQRTAVRSRSPAVQPLRTCGVRHGAPGSARIAHCQGFEFLERRYTTRQSVSRNFVSGADEASSSLGASDGYVDRGVWVELGSSEPKNLHLKGAKVRHKSKPPRACGRRPGGETVAAPSAERCRDCVTDVLLLEASEHEDARRRIRRRVVRRSRQWRPAGTPRLMGKRACDASPLCRTVSKDFS